MLKKWESFNEGKYDETWVPNIRDARIYDKGDKSIPHQRELVDYINSNNDPDIDGSSMSAREVKQWLKNVEDSAKKGVNDTINKKKLLSKIYAELEEMEITITGAPGMIRGDQEVNFIIDFLLDTGDYADVLEFLEESKWIEVSLVTDVRGMRVYYSGDIKGSNYETRSFNNINNGWSVGMG